MYLPEVIMCLVSSVVYTECAQNWPNHCHLSSPNHAVYGHFRCPSTKEWETHYMGRPPISIRTVRKLHVVAVKVSVSTLYKASVDRLQKTPFSL